MGSAHVSSKKYQHYDLQIGQIPNQGKKIPSGSLEDEEVYQLPNMDRERLTPFKLYFSGRHRYQPEVSYFGSGPDSQLGDETSFLVKDTRFDVVAGYEFTDWISWTVKTGILQHSLGPGKNSKFPSLEERFDESAAPGLSTPPNYYTIRTSLLLDRRDHPGIPRQGWVLAVAWGNFKEISQADKFNFSGYSLDARGYLPLFSKQRVLALRSLMLYTSPSTGNQVPFFLQPSLGGSHTLRGYESFRFRGEKLFMAQAEYRWEPSSWFHLAVFGDTGTVANSPNRLALSKLRSDFGIGIRVQSSRSTIFRIEQAWSNEGTRTLFRLSAVF
jgi:outer membrane protein assembly factor BamA